MNKRLQIIAWCVFAAGVVIGCKGGDEADKKAKAEQLKGMLEGEKPPAEGDVSTCTGKYAGTCLTLGVHYQKGDGGKEKDVQKALTLFERTCDGGDDMRGCSLAAHLYKQGDDGVAKDESKALGLYEKACAAKEKTGCFHAGNAYGLGLLGAERDQKKAYSYLSVACDQGDEDACKFAGMVKSALDKGTPEQQAQKCLDEKDVKLCNEVAFSFRSGEQGFKKDSKRAAEMLAVSCGEKKDKAACTLLGLIHEKGEITGTPDGAKAETAYAYACDAGGLIACRVLGKHYLLGKLVPKNPAKARPLLEKACSGDEAQACTWLAIIYKRGMGVEKDPVKSNKLLKKACDGGDKTGCKALKAQ